MLRQRTPCPKILQRKLSWIATKLQNSWKFSPSNSVLQSYCKQKSWTAAISLVKLVAKYQAVQFFPSCLSSDYHIARNFQERKLLRILRFCGYLRKFSLQTDLWEWGSLVQQKWVICESFLCENCIFHQFAKVLSLESFPVYGTTINTQLVVYKVLWLKLTACCLLSDNTNHSLSNALAWGSQSCRHGGR